MFKYIMNRDFALIAFQTCTHINYFSKEFVSKKAYIFISLNRSPFSVVVLQK